ncbi:single-stranded DNA-binding protein [Actinoplanes sp. CA-131856]
MFDTHLVVVGNVLAAPEWRRVTTSGNLVANFRIASNARRFDRERNTWVDGNSLRIRVSAWRRLAEGVASSITVGDPVIVYGRLFTRDWKDEDGNPRVSYEMEAYSIGHDLARGRGRFFRQKSLPGTAAIEDAEADMLVAGLPSIPLTPQESPIGYGEGMPGADVPSFTEPTKFPELPSELSPVAAATAPAAMAPAPAAEAPASAAEAPAPAAMASASAAEAPLPAAKAPAPDVVVPALLAEAPAPGAPTAEGPAPEAGAPSALTAAPEPEQDAASGDEETSQADDFTLEVERLTAAPPTTPARRGRRSAKKEPIAA